MRVACRVPTKSCTKKAKLKRMRQSNAELQAQNEALSLDVDERRMKARHFFTPACKSLFLWSKLQEKDLHAGTLVHARH